MRGTPSIDGHDLPVRSLSLDLQTTGRDRAHGLVVRREETTARGLERHTPDAWGVGVTAMNRPAPQGFSSVKPGADRRRQHPPGSWSLHDTFG